MTPIVSAEQIVAALPLVHGLARRYRRGSLGYDDAVGAGSLALVIAASSYEPARSPSFTGYASRRVRGAMSDAQRSLRGTRTYPDQEVLVDPEEMAARFSVEPEMCAGADLLAALRRLPPREREMVLLIAAGHPTGLVAERYGVSISRISQRMTTARARLRTAC